MEGENQKEKETTARRFPFSWSVKWNKYNISFYTAAIS